MEFITTCGSRLSAIALIALLALSPAVQAAIVDVQFQGEGSIQVEDEFGDIAGEIVTLIVGSFSIDTSTPEGASGNFVGAATGLELTVDYIDTFGDTSAADLSVFPYFTSFAFNSELATGDVFVGGAPEEIGIDFPSFGGPGPVPLSDEQFSLILQGTTGLLTQGDLVGAANVLALPNVQTMFGTAEISFQTTSLFEDPFIDGFFFDIQFLSATAVPVPAAVWLFGSGLGLLGWMRRRTA